MKRSLYQWSWEKHLRSLFLSRFVLCRSNGLKRWKGFVWLASRGSKGSSCAIVKTEWTRQCSAICKADLPTCSFFFYSTAQRLCSTPVNSWIPVPLTIDPLPPDFLLIQLLSGGGRSGVTFMQSEHCIIINIKQNFLRWIHGVNGSSFEKVHSMNFRRRENQSSRNWKIYRRCRS